MDWVALAWGMGTAILSAVFAAGGAYAATRVHLRWLRADIDRAHERIDRLDELVTATAGRL